MLTQHMAKEDELEGKVKAAIAEGKAQADKREREVGETDPAVLCWYDSCGVI